MAVGAPGGEVRLGQGLDIHLHGEVGGSVPALGAELGPGHQYGPVGDVLGRAVVADRPAPEGILAGQGQVPDLQVAVIGGEVLADVPPAIGEGHPAAAQVDRVQGVGPAVPGAEAHAGEHPHTGLRVDEVEVVALAPGPVLAGGMHVLVCACDGDHSGASH